MWTDRGWKVSSEKLCWWCEPDLQRSKLRVQQLVWIWSSGEKAGLGVKTWVSTAHRRKEEMGPGTVPGGVPRRCPGREPQLLRDGRRMALPRETRQHRQEGTAHRAGCQRSQAARAPERSNSATRAEGTSTRPRITEVDSLKHHWEESP